MDRAQRILVANLSPRYWRLDRFERYVDGTQYDGRQDWFSPTVETPLLERKPCINPPLVKQAIDSHVAFCLGDKAFPEPEMGEADDAFDKRVELSEVESELVHESIEAMWEQCNVERISRDAMTAGLGCGTAVAVVSVKRGRFHVERLRAKWCKPTFEDDELVSVEVCYPYMTQVQDQATGQWEQRCLLYRRTIDGVADTVYKPILASESGLRPDEQEWEIDRQVEHNLGFCPVVWWRTFQGCENVDDYDGHPIHETLLDELDAYAFALSQKHRAALYSSDPLLIETGVDPETNSVPTGRTARVVIRDSGGHAYYGVDGGEVARKRQPGGVWSFMDANVDVKLLTLPGDALKAADDNAMAIEAHLRGALNLVQIQAKNMDANAWSGAAIKQLYRQQIEFCDVLRSDFERGFLMPLTQIMLRMLAVMPGGIYIKNAPQLRRVLQRFQMDGWWLGPSLRLCWGDYFQPTADDLAKEAQAAVTLLGAGVITKASALERVKEFFNIEDAEEYAAEMKPNAITEESLDDVIGKLGSPEAEQED